MLLRERAQAVVRIRDHGPGVAESELEKIFLPFYRTDKARESVRDGKGLGLSISRRIVSECGGAVVATNAEGGGLMMTVRLPLVADS